MAFEPLLKKLYFCSQKLPYSLILSSQINRSNAEIHTKKIDDEKTHLSINIVTGRWSKTAQSSRTFIIYDLFKKPCFRANSRKKCDHQSSFFVNCLATLDQKSKKKQYWYYTEFLKKCPWRKEVKKKAITNGYFLKNFTKCTILFLALFLTWKCPLCVTAAKKYIVKKPTSLLLYISLHT